MTLSRCAGCGRDTGIRFFEPGPYLFLVYYVRCAECEARSKDCETERGAIRSWNAMQRRELRRRKAA